MKLEGTGLILRVSYGYEIRTCPFFLTKDEEFFAALSIEAIFNHRVGSPHLRHPPKMNRGSSSGC
jgi:hypothetical protein